jgi:hypothetical protein
LWVMRVDGRGFVDSAEVAAFEKAQGDQIGEAQDRDLDAVAAGGDAQQRVGDHRGEDLEADRVVVVAEKAADVEMLFDPAKQRFLKEVSSWRSTRLFRSKHGRRRASGF